MDKNKKRYLKEITKLTKIEKIMLVIWILNGIYDLFVAYITKNTVWILVSVMWFLLAHQEYTHLKSKKLDNKLIETQSTLISKIFQILSTNKEEK